MPCLLFNGSSLVKTKKFKKPVYIGDPINAIKIYNEKEVDELVFLDINASIEKRKPDFEMIKQITSECFMPFTYGGGVSNIDDFKTLFSLGVEKVALNTLILKSPETVKQAVAMFGAQAIISVVDIKSSLFGKQKIYNKTGFSYGKSIKSYLHYLQDEIGVGEILIQNVDREGTWEGYDHELILELSKECKVPLIALGGANSPQDIERVLYTSGADGSAIGSLAVFQKKDMGVLIKFPNRNLIIKE